MEFTLKIVLIQNVGVFFQDFVNWTSMVLLKVLERLHQKLVWSVFLFVLTTAIRIDNVLLLLNILFYSDKLQFLYVLPLLQAAKHMFVSIFQIFYSRFFSRFPKSNRLIKVIQNLFMVLFRLHAMRNWRYFLIFCTVQDLFGDGLPRVCIDF